MMLAEGIEIAGVKISNRIAAAPVASQLFDGGSATEKAVELYTKLAASGVGIAVLEHHAVHPWGRNRTNQPRLDRDEFAESLRAVVEPFKKAKVPVLAQINYAGSMTAGADLLEMDDFEYTSPSGIHGPIDAIKDATPRELSRAEISEIVEAFASAAVRAIKISGYDGVQIHCAHSYLLGQFLSPLTNRRTDEYGGSEKKRARLLYEVADAVRQETKGHILCVRLGMADHLPDEPMRGLSIDDTVPVARELVSLGVDWLALSGNHCGFGAKRTGDDAYFAPFVRAIHDALRGAIPCDCCGGIRSPQTANELLASKTCELISLARPLFKELDLPKKWLAQG